MRLWRPPFCFGFDNLTTGLWIRRCRNASRFKEDVLRCLSLNVHWTPLPRALPAHTFNLVWPQTGALVRSSSQNPNSMVVAWPGLRLLQGKGPLPLRAVLALTKLSCQYLSQRSISLRLPPHQSQKGPQGPSGTVRTVLPSFEPSQPPLCPRPSSTPFKDALHDPGPDPSAPFSPTPAFALMLCHHHGDCVQI